MILDWDKVCLERKPAAIRNVMIGELIGSRYKVVNVLASGGFGHTYIAEDIQRPGNPRCVLKHLTFSSNDPGVLQQVRRLFQAEAETLERLGRHDRIPRLLAYFEENHQFYLVQEFIEGHPLSQELVKGVRLSEDEVIPLLEDVLGILEFVHAQGVVHRDIKPANLIRRRQDSKLVLIDFGAVKTLGNTIAEATGDTSLSMPVYTSGYAASEQCMGRPQFSSDLYSLGIVGIQALTGLHPSQLPTDYQTSELIWRDRAQVSDGLADVLDRMTRYHFTDRYQSASEVLEALRDVISKAPTLVSRIDFSGEFSSSSPTVLADKTAAQSLEGSQSLQSRSVSTQVTPATRSRKSLTCVGLALLGTLAIAALVKELSTPRIFPPLGTSPTDATTAATASDRISVGENLLNQWQSSPEKQAGIDAIAAGNYSQAIAALEKARQQDPTDPETLIYLNNARIGTAKSYEIAVVIPVNSPSLAQGMEILRGVAQAQDEVNRAGGINNVPLRVAIADDNGQPETAKQMAELLARDPQVLGVVGHGSSNTSIEAAKVYQDQQLVMVAPVSSAVPLSDVGNFIFRTMVTDNQTAKALKDYMLTRLNKRKVAIFYNPNDSYSKSLTREFRNALDYSGVQDVTVVDEMDLSRPDFDAEESVNRAIANQAEVLMLVPNADVMDRAIRVIENNNRRLPVLAGDIMYNFKVPRIAKEKAVGMVVAVPVDPTGLPFLQQASALWKHENLVTWRTVLAYDATKVLLAAIAQDPSRISIQRILSQPNFSTPGAEGPISFQAKGNRQNQPVYITVAPLGQKREQGYTFVPLR
jgi:ABC-type branched-subunit amino acid transport system substrate-binding protein/predicted Ser/Thr protein kinase